MMRQRRSGAPPISAGASPSDATRRADGDDAAEGKRMNCPWFDRLCSLISRSLFLLFALAFAAPALAEKGKLAERLTPEVMAIVFPGAERLGPEEGSPPAIAAYKGDKVVAYLFSTLDIVNARAYSVIPFDVIAGVTPEGRITGAKAVFHREPYVYQDPVRQPQLDTFLAADAGQALNSPPPIRPDSVAQSTITARLMRAAVHDTARLVLNARVARQSVTVPTLDVERFELKTWD